MSWYTAGEIVVWLLIAALLGFVLGWLLRGILRAPRRAAPVPPPVRSEPGRTEVTEVDLSLIHI